MKNGFLNQLKQGTVKNGHIILTSLGIAGMATSIVLTGIATSKAVRKIDQAENGENYKTKLTNKEKVKLVWKEYIPAAVTATVSAGCIIGSHKVTSKKYAALATAYKVSENVFSDYRKEVKKTIGEEAEKKIKQEVDKKHENEKKISAKEVVITRGGDTLFYDSLSGRYFRSDKKSLEEAENVINHKMLNENELSLNEVYYLMGLDPIYPLGENLKWNVERGMLHFSYDSHIADNDEPCIEVNYSMSPKDINY